MQLPDDEQPLLAGPPTRLLPDRLGPVGPPFAADAHDLDGGPEEQEPAGIQGLTDDAADLLLLVRVQRR